MVVCSALLGPGARMPDAASAAHGVWKPRRPQASVIDQILAHLRARRAPAAHAGASDWSRRDRPPTSTAVRTALTAPERDGGHGTARHAALARSAIAPYSRRTVNPPRLKFLSRVYTGLKPVVKVDQGVLWPVRK